MGRQYDSPRGGYSHLCCSTSLLWRVLIHRNYRHVMTDGIVAVMITGAIAVGIFLQLSTDNNMIKWAQQRYDVHLSYTDVGHLQNGDTIDLDDTTIRLTSTNTGEHALLAVHTKTRQEELPRS